MRWVLCLVLFFLTSAAEAQIVGESVGELYLSGSPDGYVSDITATSFTEFDFYIVAEIDYADIGHSDWNSTNGLAVWEAGESFTPEVIVTGREWYPYAWLPLEAWQWVYGIGGTILADEMPYRLLRYTALISTFPAPNDLRMRLRAYQPSSFDPPRPGFADGALVGECALPDDTPAKCRRAFAVVRDLWINRTVPVEAASWSALKSRFEP